ncbi:hypothetical protein MLD52_18575 [Puniceicoccaceae bacterium K14]|nr:hypothetical protein [Puniceicoccaceae bacterium K14]
MKNLLLKSVLGRIVFFLGVISSLCALSMAEIVSPQDDQDSSYVKFKGGTASDLVDVLGTRGINVLVTSYAEKVIVPAFEVRNVNEDQLLGALESLMTIENPSISIRVRQGFPSREEGKTVWALLEQLSLK